MRLYSLQEHLLELKTRIIRILLVFVIFCGISYYFSKEIYAIALNPLVSLEQWQHRNIIYTGLTEAFFTYLKLAAFTSTLVIIPFIAIEVYLFIKPALYPNEQKLAAYILLMAPLLFWLGSIFVYYFVMPKAWLFFLSFENSVGSSAITLEPRISEYLTLVMQLIIAFGVAFQLPIVILILHILKIITIEQLKDKRRLAVVINFIIAAILTPPDVISQFALAIPMVLLYETAIIMCKFTTNRG